MTDGTMAMLDRLIESHRAQISEMKDELRVFERARGRIANAIGPKPAKSGSLFSEASPAACTVNMSAGDVAVQVLRESDHPMHGTREILPAIIARLGDGSIKRPSLAPALRRRELSGEIKRTGPNLWVYVGSKEDPDA